ncbi:glycerate kinase [Alginatibacterium sediminis]|uniref:Glycerate kinase n=1 Tax=Alginatibacterium sediminis TaxID=2164068 RepID=A0A420E7T9_9ALTE|nr:glycerate kinase [Alginatibacterium sediminis]RKF14551.1 glycerate kinase [Alginatibacterium sediminis]
MKIVIAPDSFKESLSAMQVAQCIENGFKSVFNEAEFVKLPLADGGEGTVDVLLQSVEGQRLVKSVVGPYGAKFLAHWGLLNQGKTAVVEIAAASGLELTNPARRNPGLSTSYGTGELIRHALDSGVDKIILGLGGSATNDGGAGILQALGARLLDSSGTVLPRGGAALELLDSLDLSQIHPRCRDVEFLIACDVKNPLCGPHGASAIFGPQKGATPAQIIELDSALRRFAQVVEQISGHDHCDTPGYGAAGGAPLGLSLVFDVQLLPGIDLILSALNAEDIFSEAQLVITGEGQMDNQTLQGKTPYGVAKLCKQLEIPCIGIAGSLGSEREELSDYFNATFASVRAPGSLRHALQEASENLTQTAANVARTLACGQQLN